MVKDTFAIPRVVISKMTPSPPDLPCFTREEVAQHKKFKDCWVILHGEVYDVTEWLAKHPGGATVLFHYAGQDASVGYARMRRRKKSPASFLCVCSAVF